MTRIDTVRLIADAAVNVYQNNSSLHALRHTVGCDNRRERTTNRQATRSHETLHDGDDAHHPDRYRLNGEGKVGGTSFGV